MDAMVTQALRALIERIVLEPGSKRGEVLATLNGDLEAILAWTADQRGQRLDAVMGFPAGSLSSQSTHGEGSRRLSGDRQSPVNSALFLPEPDDLGDGDRSTPPELPWTCPYSRRLPREAPLVPSAKSRRCGASSAG